MDRKNLCITIKLEMVLLTGKVCQFQVLYNNGAKINLIKYDLVKEYDFTLLQRRQKPIIGFLDKHQIKLYSTYKLTVSVTNIYNRTKVVSL